MLQNWQGLRSLTRVSLIGTHRVRLRVHRGAGASSLIGNQPAWDSPTGCVCPGQGHGARSPVPFPNVCLACRQNFIVHSTAENQASAHRTACFLTIRDKRPGEVSLTGTRSPGRIVPYRSTVTVRTSEAPAPHLNWAKPAPYRAGNALVPDTSDFAVGLWVGCDGGCRSVVGYGSKLARSEEPDTSVPSLEHIESGTGCTAEQELRPSSGRIESGTVILISGGSEIEGRFRSNRPLRMRFKRKAFPLLCGRCIYRIRFSGTRRSEPRSANR